jgi:hypothetical protein
VAAPGFAGSVAGSLHVVVAHDGGLRTSYSFLASVAVRRGQSVRRGTVVGTAGGGTGEHAGVLHLGLRVGDRYADPMLLFAPTDLTRLIRLVPVDEPDRAGLDPPALERRALADALHLPQGIPGVRAEETGGVLGAVRGAVEGAVGEAVALARLATAPVRAPLARLGATAVRWWQRTPASVVLADAGRIAVRAADWVRSRSECVDDPAAPPGGGGSGHLVLAVGGLDSATGPEGASFGLDVGRLGYRDDEVRWFSYAADGGPYRPAATHGDVRVAAQRLGDQLRALQREQPGREVDLVGHSLGGVVVATFLGDLYDPGDPTLPPLGTVVTLASPLRGTPAATAVRRAGASTVGRAAVGERTDSLAVRQLGDGSRFVRGLVDRRLPEQIDLTAIAAVDDVVVPADHAVHRDGRAVTVDPSGWSDHARIVDDPAAMDAARLTLEGRGLPCVGVVDGLRGAVEPVLVSRAERVGGEVGARAGRLLDAVGGGS